ncbi:hypothetical protein L7F22_069036 [Adiantum nelumboides]|nr:hypothetical protein [Adiantum nelumboides]
MLSGRYGSTRKKHSYHRDRVIELDSDTGTGTDESNQSKWKMKTGKASKKERIEGHMSKSLDGHYRKDKGLDLKIACPIFKGKKHDDPNVHIQAFEQYGELKHILEEEWGEYTWEEEWGEYFPHTLKEAAKKWYYHYPTSKLHSYRKLKKACILEYTDDRGDEDILCELDKIKQGKLSIKNGFNSRNLREQEVPTRTKKFIELVHRALKLEQHAKKDKSSSLDSNTSASSESKKSSSSSSKSEEDERKKKKKKGSWSRKIDEMSRKIFEISGLRGSTRKSERWQFSFNTSCCATFVAVLCFSSSVYLVSLRLCVVPLLSDMEDEGDDDDEADDTEDQSRTLGHNQDLDDDNHNDPPSGNVPSIGAANEPSNPPGPQLEPPPPAPKGQKQDDRGASGTNEGVQKQMVETK